MLGVEKMDRIGSGIVGATDLVGKFFPTKKMFQKKTGIVAPASELSDKKKVNDIFLKAGFKRPSEYMKAGVTIVDGKLLPWGLDY